MEHRTILALSLAALIFFLWQYFFPIPKPQMPSEKGDRPIQERPPVPKLPTSPVPKLPTSPTESSALPEKEVIVETNLLRVVLSTKGGSVKSWQLKQYKLEGGNPVELVAPPQSAAPLAPLTSWIESDPYLQSYQVDKERLTLLSKVERGAITFTADTPSGLRVEKTLSFQGDDYQLQVTLNVKNLRGEDLVVAPKLLWGSGFMGYTVQNATSLRLTTWVDGKRVERPVGQLKGDVAYDGRVSWTALHDTYFAAALLPLESGAKAFTQRDERGEPVVGLVGEAKRLPPGGEVKAAFAVYAGPKELDRLRASDHDLEGLVNLGWSDFLARPVLYFLKFIHRYLGNYGIAIITLSILVKVFSFPLTYKTMKSMQAMKQLQPKFEAIKEKYKNNPKRKREETVKLYQQYGVNPLGGCLPMLLQIPIFAAIYNALAYSVELWRAPFDGYWITDLSIPDKLGLLPILMGISMFIQQKMSPQAGDPKQAQLMLYMMPVMMTFVFWKFPAGLNLYWTVFNILSIGQQYLFNQWMAQASLEARRET